LYLNTIKEQGLFAVVKADALDRIYSKGGKDKELRDHCQALVDGGVSTFEVTCRSPIWKLAAYQVVEAAKSVNGLIPAVGTHANILTLHEAVEMGVPVNVAADRKSVV
jgi:2-keto-3-deoxy-6-phosphogluconate aldolase